MIPIPARFNRQLLQLTLNQHTFSERYKTTGPGDELYWAHSGPRLEWLPSSTIWDLGWEEHRFLHMYVPPSPPPRRCFSILSRARIGCCQQKWDDPISNQRNLAQARNKGEQLPLYWCFYVYFYCSLNGFRKEVSVIEVYDWRRIVGRKSFTKALDGYFTACSYPWS